LSKHFESEGIGRKTTEEGSRNRLIRYDLTALTDLQLEVQEHHHFRYLREKGTSPRAFEGCFGISNTYSVHDEELFFENQTLEGPVCRTKTFNNLYRLGATT